MSSTTLSWHSCLRVFWRAFAGASHAQRVDWHRSLLLIAGCLYYVLFESSSMQATLGKTALDIKVTDLHGERIGFGRALGRMFGALPELHDLQFRFRHGRVYRAAPDASRQVGRHPGREPRRIARRY